MEILLLIKDCCTKISLHLQRWCAFPLKHWKSWIILCLLSTFSIITKDIWNRNSFVHIQSFWWSLVSLFEVLEFLKSSIFETIYLFVVRFLWALFCAIHNVWFCLQCLWNQVKMYSNRLHIRHWRASFIFQINWQISHAILWRD